MYTKEYLDARQNGLTIFVIDEPVVRRRESAETRLVRLLAQPKLNLRAAGAISKLLAKVTEERLAAAILTVDEFAPIRLPIGQHVHELHDPISRVSDFVRMFDWVAARKDHAES